MEPIKHRRRYEESFKREAIRLVTETGRPVSSVERDLGIPSGLLSKWTSSVKNNPVSPFPGKGHLSIQDAEVHRLRRENDILREERDILKKAVAIFSKTPRTHIVL
jgi:transposase